MHMESLKRIQLLVKEKTEAEKRLSLMAYYGSPEIKKKPSGKYLYIRKRVAGKHTSKYVGVYSDKLYHSLLRNANESRELKRRIRQISKELLELGYSSDEHLKDGYEQYVRSRIDEHFKSNRYR